MIEIFDDNVIMKLLTSFSLCYLCYLISLADTSILESLPPDSDQQQALITAIKDYDGYNWG